MQIEPCIMCDFIWTEVRKGIVRQKERWSLELRETDDALDGCVIWHKSLQMPVSISSSVKWDDGNCLPTKQSSCEDYMR